MSTFIIVTKDGEVREHSIVRVDPPRRHVINTSFIREVSIGDADDTLIRFDGQGNFAGQTWSVTQSFDSICDALAAEEVAS